MKVNLPALKNFFVAQSRKFTLFQINRYLQKRFEQEREKLLDEIENHPISKELESHTNPSAFLSGVSGSLFGFLGFSEGSEPIKELLRFLKRNIRFIPATTLNFRYETKVFLSIPLPENLATYFPLEWEPGNSWVTGIENGISGLGNYLSIASGRSLEGVEIGKIRDKEFHPTPYLTPILTEFKNSIK